MINKYKTYWTNKALTGIISLLALLSSCTDNIVSDAEEEISAPFGYINVGASLGDPEMTTRAEVQIPNKATGHYYAETVDWLKGALETGVDITYSNIDANGNRVFANERVGILKWDGQTTSTANGAKATYTFHYKKGTADTNQKAEWNSNGQHYFEGQYVPAEIRWNEPNPISAQNLTSDQTDNAPSTGTIGNYTLLSHYIGMPPSYKERATVNQILLPFKHRLARVIAYVLIDDMLEATLEGYDVPKTATYGVDGKIEIKDNPATTELLFSYVKVLEKVKVQVDHVGSDDNVAEISKLTPIWKGGYTGEFNDEEQEKPARSVTPHFYNEVRRSVKSDGSLAAEDDDAKNFFIVYINTKTDKKVHPRESNWATVHKEFRKAGGYEGNNDKMASDKVAIAEESTGYRRQMYSRVPIYDIIVRPTYNTSYDNVMYDEEGYYVTDNSGHKTSVNTTKRNRIYDQNNSIQFDLELSSHLKYSKLFTFDLNANQQTVVYLRIDREGISYDESSYELWDEKVSTDGYYGVDNEEGHNLSMVGSSWQRALRNGPDPSWKVTDGSNYGDKDNNSGLNNVDDGQYVSDTKWTMELAKAGVGGSRQGDYFMLDTDITIDMRLLPEEFVFAGHLDGKSHTITLSHCNEEAVKYVEASVDDLFYKGDLYKQNSKSTTGNNYEAFTAPTLYKFEPTGVIEDMDDDNLNNPSTDGSIEDLDDGQINDSTNGSIEDMDDGNLNNSSNGSIEDMEEESLTSTTRSAKTRSDDNEDPTSNGLFRELTQEEKDELKLSDLKRTNETIYYIQNTDGKYSRYYLTDKEIAKFFKYVGTYISASTLFAGLNGTYSGEAGKYNLHNETDYKGNIHLVPVEGYRGEVLNVTLTNKEEATFPTFFPTNAVYTGSDLNLSGATVTGYIFNCWEKDSNGNWRKVENIVPIP